MAISFLDFAGLKIGVYCLLLFIGEHVLLGLARFCFEPSGGFGSVRLFNNVLGIGLCRYSKLGHVSVPWVAPLFSFWLLLFRIYATASPLLNIGTLKYLIQKLYSINPENFRR